jgi:ABC-type multidrug transport system ATPase subunit
MPEAAVRRSADVEEEGAPRQASAPILALSGIVKSWSSQPKPVLDGVSLELQPATTTAISGRNGAGKTTLLRVAAGLIGPERGSVTASGLDVDRDRTRFQRRIGFLAAGNSGLYARLKVEHHLDLWSRIALMPRRERRPAVAAAIDTFTLEPLLGRRVDRLSMGQRQRLRLALAFLHGPSVVLLDEPTTSLDAEGVALLERAIESLKAHGGGALVCLPSGSDQHLTIDRSLVLSGGTLEEA